MTEPKGSLLSSVSSRSPNGPAAALVDGVAIGCIASSQSTSSSSSSAWCAVFRLFEFGGDGASSKWALLTSLRKLSLSEPANWSKKALLSCKVADTAGLSAVSKMLGFLADFGVGPLGEGVRFEGMKGGMLRLCNYEQCIIIITTIGILFAALMTCLS